MEIRAAADSDHAGIRAVETAAFGRPDEADLVERLRRDGAVIAELVAIEAGRPVGHVLFSALGRSAGTGRGPIAALAPLAVEPGWWRRGIGSALVRHGLERCGRAGVAAVVVLGDPAFYPRFGFSARIAERLRSPFAGAAFMALELVVGTLRDGETIRYPAAFGSVSRKDGAT